MNMKNLFLILIVSVNSLTAQTVITQQSASFYIKQSDKVVLSEKIPAKTALEVTGAIVKNKYVPVRWKDQEGWIIKKTLVASNRDKPLRSISSIDGSMRTSVWRVGADLGVQTQSIGAGAGINGGRKLPLSFHPAVTTDIIASFRYFPSVAFGSSAMEISAGARALYRFHKKMEAGFEMSLTYISIKYTNVLANSMYGTYYSGSESALGVTLGGLYTFQLLSDLYLVGSPKLLVYTSIGVLLTAGVEFRF